MSEGTTSPKWKGYRAAAVLWDLDGTLADTVDDIAWAVDSTLLECGLAPLGVDRVRGMIGDGAAKLVDRAVRAAGAEPAEQHIATFRRIYRAHPRRTAEVFPGMFDVLAAVAVPQALVTNKPEDVTRPLCEALGLTRWFALVLGGDSLPWRKPDGRPLTHAMNALGVSTAVMVGDGPHDVGAAKNAGLPSIGVQWGILSPEEADVRVSTAAELRTALARFGVCR